MTHANRKESHGETSSLVPEWPGSGGFSATFSPRGSASCLLEGPAGFPSVALSAEAGLYLGEPRSRGVR